MDYDAGKRHKAATKRWVKRSLAKAQPRGGEQS